MFPIYYRIFAFILTIAFYSHTVISQSCDLTVKGQIRDFHEDLSLEYATVYIQELKTGVTTDEMGKFELNQLCKGDYHFIISHIGCASKTIYFSLQRDTTIQIFMEHHDELLDEVIIEAIGTQNKTGLVKSVISKDMIFEMSGQNLTEMLKAIPGVSILRSGPNLTKPIINGLYGNRITVLNHGLPQEGQQWGNDHAPEIDPNTADKISIFKGSNAIKYGLSTLGGLVVIEPDDLSYDPLWHGNLKITGQTNGRSYGMQTALRKSTSWGNTRWTAGFTNSGDRHTPDYYLTNTGNKEKSMSMLWSNSQTSRAYRKFYYSFYQNEIGILRGSHIGNLTDLRNAIGRNVPFFTQDSFSYAINAPRQNVKHHLAKYSQKYFMSESLILNIDAGFQANLRQEYDVRRGGRSDRPTLDLVLLSQFYDVQLTHQGSNPGEVQSAGIQYKINDNSNQTGTGINPLIPNYLNHQLASYFIYKNKWKSVLWELGVRAEYRDYQIYRSENTGGYARHHFFNMAGNLGFKKNINKGISATLDISYTGRPPEINELYSFGLHQGVSGIEEGNPGLQPEHSFKIVQEWNGHLTHHHHVHMSLFYNKFRNFIYLQPSDEFRLTIRGAFPLYRYVAANADIAGLSLKSNLEINKNLLWSNTFNYTYGQNRTMGHGLIRIPPLNAVSNISYTISKSAWFEEMKLGTEISYTAKQNRFNEKEDFLLPPESYVLFNGFLKMKWKTNSKNDIDLVIRGENLLDTSYRDYLNRLRYFADEMGRNIYVNINIKF
ncbi:MAG: carboxypeptidase-like regulatory domain-containing protein [Saprospiraceae bacterium]